MFTSHKPPEGKRYASVTGAYLLAAVFCGFFGAVYELFSHGVYSCFMLCAFAFPLLLGSIPFFMMRRAGRPFPGKGEDLIHAGIAALTVGSLLQGVLEIYGTSNPLTALYWIAGAALTAAGWLWACKKPAGNSRGREQSI